MILLLRILVKAAVIMWLLPALGLIAFHGGFGAAIGTVIITAIMSVIAGGVLTVALWRTGLYTVWLGAEIAGIDGVRWALFIIGAIVGTIGFWLASAMVSGVVLLGPGKTFICGLILALIGSVIHRHRRVVR